MIKDYEKKLKETGKSVDDRWFRRFFKKTGNNRWEVDDLAWIEYWGFLKIRNSVDFIV